MAKKSHLHLCPQWKNTLRGHTKLKPNLNGLPEWGSQVWVHNASNSKLDARAMTGHWMGYDTEIKDSCVYWPERRKVSVEHNICFDPEFIVI